MFLCIRIAIIWYKVCIKYLAIVSSCLFLFWSQEKVDALLHFQTKHILSWNMLKKNKFPNGDHKKSWPTYQLCTGREAGIKSFANAELEHKAVLLINTKTLASHAIRELMWWLWIAFNTPIYSLILKLNFGQTWLHDVWYKHLCKADEIQNYSDFKVFPID